jgi:hypothetical protein
LSCGFDGHSQHAKTDSGHAKTIACADPHELMNSGAIILTAENKSATTITSYLRCARSYLQRCERHGHPVELTRVQVQRYAAELISGGGDAVDDVDIRRATRWLRAGGSESGLMAVAGWSTRDMIDRYTGASASERARSARRLASVRASWACPELLSTYGASMLFEVGLHL